MAKNDKGLDRWPGFSKDDKIRWVEERLRDRQAAAAGLVADDLDAKGIPDAVSLQVWLAKERDGLSWQQIAIKHYPNYKNPKLGGVSKARRAYRAVERSPEPKRAFKHLMEERIQELFGCSPEDFKRYIDSIRINKPSK